ncbi:MAG: hypothetical protein ACJAZP_000901 [Psychromonas sp.]|jgi:hypothetical protein
MKLYDGIDLHSNNSVFPIKDFLVRRLSRRVYLHQKDRAAHDLMRTTIESHFVF